MLWRVSVVYRSCFRVRNYSTIKTAATAAITSTTPTAPTTPTTTSTTTPPEPLRILFCGSDAFSIESLRALHEAQQSNPALIEAIHVVHRPAKPTGRGLKTLREVPLAAYAASLALPTTPLNTFTHHTPSFPYTLIIAVSFGLLIPARILARAPHGGLNVHPSLLPDLRGSAPIPHALLKNRHHTGVSVQTLHPTTFDAGTVLAQTPPPGVRIFEAETRGELEKRLAAEGARLLLDVLRERRYLPPLRQEAWYAGPTEYAPKITKADHFVDFATMGLQRVLAGVRALGHVWCVLPNGERLVVHEVSALDGAGDSTPPPAQTGLWYDDARRELLFRAECGGVGVVRASTYPGGKAGMGNAKAAKVLRGQAKV